MMDRRGVARRTAGAGLLAAPAAALLGAAPAAASSGMQAAVAAPSGARAAVAASSGTVINLVERGLVAGDADTAAAANTEIWETASVEASAAGGVVYLPGSGAYRFTGPLHLDEAVHYVSDGATLKLADGANRDLMRTRGFETLWGTTSTAGPARWSLTGFILDGNTTAQTADCFPLSLWGRNFTLEHLRVRNGRGGGLRSGNGPGGVLMEARLRDVTVHDNGKVNLDWRGPNDSQFSDLIVYVDSPSGAAVPARGVRFSGNANGAQVDRLHIWGFFECGLELASGGVAVYNGVAEGAQVNVWVQANSCIYEGTIFGTAGTGPYRGTEVGYRLGLGTPGVTNWNNRLRATMHRWSVGDRPIELVADNGTNIDVCVLASTATGVVFGTRDYKSAINVMCPDQPRFSERAGGFSGTGAPRSEFGVVGSLYTRTDGAAGGYLYRKTSATAWTAIL